MKQFDKIIQCLPLRIQQQIDQLESPNINHVEEIRIHKGNEIILSAGNEERKLSGKIDGSEIKNILNNLMKFSYYAYEDDIAKGFITIDGGHRVGLCGKAVMNNGKVTLIKDISSLNIRYSKEVPGCADSLMPYIFTPQSRILNTLIVSPPNCGKTTMLRDIARQLSLKNYKVAICDERSEIAAMCNGISSYSFGEKIDVLDGCPKAVGLKMLVRSMSPQVIITDEIGRQEDVDAIKGCTTCGISVITSIHGNDLTDLQNSDIYETIQKKIFNVIIFLTNIPKVGTIREVFHD